MTKYTFMICYSLVLRREINFELYNLAGSDDVLSLAMTSVVFVYTGPGGEGVPKDVVRIRVDPSVTSIPPRAFQHSKKLAEVELCEGLVEIGEYSFWWCDHSITKIIIPNSLRRINNYAFSGSLQTPIRLHNGIESIGEEAFGNCIFTNFRVPPLITVIPNGMLWNCRSMFSLELSENVRQMELMPSATVYEMWPYLPMPIFLITSLVDKVHSNSTIFISCLVR
jgi:hypothetical protein